MKHSELSRIEVSKIMQGNKNAILIHAEKRYLLSITRRGKLILTGAVNNDGVFNLPIRIASRLSEVYVDKLSIKWAK